MSLQIEFNKAKWFEDSDGIHITLSVLPKYRAAVKEFCLKMENKLYTAILKKFFPRRSLAANDYSWKLTDELAEKMLVANVKLSKEEMHAEMIFRYGQVMQDDAGQQVVISTSQGVKMPEFYPYAKEIGEGEVNGKTFTHFRIYRGSHTYDSREMSLFIKGIVEECKELGIETKTPEELALLKGLEDE